MHVLLLLLLSLTHCFIVIKSNNIAFTIILYVYIFHITASIHHALFEYTNSNGNVNLLIILLN